VLPKNEFYMPIVTGYRKEEFTQKEYILDNEGENIAFKNNNYSELTAQYWIYKNSNDLIKGLVHYRRYFVYPRFKFIIFGFNSALLKKDKVYEFLQKYDIIVPKKVYLGESSLWELYSEAHFEKDLLVTQNVIEDLYPEYLDSFKFNLLSNDFTFYGNMLIAKQNLFDNYSKWLFDILFEVESRIDTSEYDSYQQRVYGFLSERLLNVFIYKNNLKIKEVYVLNIESYSVIKMLRELLGDFLRFLKIYKFVRQLYLRVKNGI
jgi:hypothetical protein